MIVWKSHHKVADGDPQVIVRATLSFPTSTGLHHGTPKVGYRQSEWENVIQINMWRIPANSRYILHVWDTSFRAISLAKSIDAGVSPIDVTTLNFVCYIWLLDRVLSSTTKKRWSDTGCAPDTQFVFHNVA